MNHSPLNVFGEPLQPCCYHPLTGFYRDGFCHTDAHDLGHHVICAEMTDEFLAFTKARGNDLTTPQPAFNFPGLQPGDRWCICAIRWQEAYEQGVAPPVFLASCQQKALNYVSLEVLQRYALPQG